MKADLACGHTTRSLPRKFLKVISGFWCPTCSAVKPRVGDHGPAYENVTVKKPSGRANQGVPMDDDMLP